MVMCIMESDVFVCGGGVDEGAVGGEEVAGLTVGLGCEEGADAGEFGVELLFVRLLVGSSRSGKIWGRLRHEGKLYLRKGNCDVAIMREKGERTGRSLLVAASNSSACTPSSTYPENRHDPPSTHPPSY